MSARRVLVIDEGSDPYLKTCIEIVQAEPLFARNVGDAIKIAEEKEPHAILMNLSTSGGLVDDLAKLLKDHPSTSHIPVTFLTEDDVGHKAKSAAKKEGYNYLSRRLHPQDFINQLQSFIA
jgi:CheY-like chemotaxis protein